LKNSFGLALIWLLAAGIGSAQEYDPLGLHRLGRSDSTRITVIYPKAGQTLGAVDSTFILGHLPTSLSIDPDDLVLVVNDSLEFPIHRDGGFLAWVPISPGEFVFRLRAFPKSLDVDYRMADVAAAAGSLAVVVPEPRTSPGTDTLAILGEYTRPAGDLVMRAGDRLYFDFQATPGMIAWASLPGVSDSIPMTETPPRTQAYWGESVFGLGAVPDSLLIRGIYSGSVSIPESTMVVDTTLTYHLAVPPAVREVILRLMGVSDSALLDTVHFFGLKLRDSARSTYRLTLNSPDFPFTVRFVDSVQTIRHGPRRGYFSIFQPAGVEAEVIGAEGDWYRLQLSESQYAWAARESVEPLARGLNPPQSLLRVIRTYRGEDNTRVEFPLSGKHAYQVIEDDPQTIRVRLFGVTSDTDWIRYDFTDPLIDYAVWDQPEPGLYEVTVHTTRGIWGYDSYYEGNRLYLQLNDPPEDLQTIRGKRIVIDPGHSADPGAIGPTGMTEAEANLGISKVLQYILERRGADVIMTREDTSHVPLYDRPAIAKSVDADLFVSVHNNALPDGVNPFTNNGTSSFYYHPHSMPLARAQPSLTRRFAFSAPAHRSPRIWSRNMSLCLPIPAPHSSRRRKIMRSSSST